MIENKLTSYSRFGHRPGSGERGIIREGKLLEVGALGTPLKDSEVDQAIATLEYWRRNGNMIERDYKFDDFLHAIRFVNRIAEVAEEANHHPDIYISFNRVKLVLTSHDSGGVTTRDIQLAGRINKMKV